MYWKDFFYYRRGSALAVVILLTFILLTLIFNAILSLRNTSEIVIEQNDSIVLEFIAFKDSLKTKKIVETNEIVEIGNTRRTIESNQLLESPQSSETSQSLQSSQSLQPNGNSYYQNHISEKLSPGQVISLNETDTSVWKKIPGIGSSYSSRIIKYKDLLGGYVNKEQLLEVYGIDNDLYVKISPFIQEDSNYTKVKINELEFKELLKHPYLNYKQVQVIVNLRQKKGDIISVNELSMLDEFTSEDIMRLEPYLHF